MFRVLGCTYTGTITIKDPNTNVYSITGTTTAPWLDNDGATLPVVGVFTVIPKGLLQGGMTSGLAPSARPRWIPRDQNSGRSPRSLTRTNLIGLCYRYIPCFHRSDIDTLSGGNSQEYFGFKCGLDGHLEAWGPT